MFERYTEKARRTIFFARYEASQFGAEFIEPGHLLLGLLREDRTLLPALEFEAIRKEIEARYPIREKVSTSVDMPLSNPSKRILAYAAEEAERLNHKFVGTGHLLLGFSREKPSDCEQLLRAHRVDFDAVRQKLIAEPPSELAMPFAAGQLMPPPREGPLLNESQRIYNGHPIRTKERIQLSEDGKKLVYSIEVQGPGKTGAYEITFELD